MKSTMTVDLSKVQAGCKAKFRCGGEAVVEGIRNPHVKSTGLYLYLKFSSDCEEFYYSDGHHGTHDHPFDIVAVEPPPPLTAEERLALIADRLTKIIERDNPVPTLSEGLDLLSLAKGEAP
jgi:hypothetical protein